MVGGHIAWLSRQSVFSPLIVGVTCSGIGPTGQAGHIVAANIRNHQRTCRVLVLTAVGPVIQMLVILVA